MESADRGRVDRVPLRRGRQGVCGVQEAAKGEMNILTNCRALLSGDGLACPHCEKPLEGHDQAACERGMSRRYFFGSLLGGVAAAATAPKAIQTVLTTAGWAGDTVLVKGSNIILATDAFSRFARANALYDLSLLRSELDCAVHIVGRE